MNNNKQQENKIEDKRALKKYWIMLVLSVVAGMIFGAAAVLTRGIKDDTVNMALLTEIAKNIGVYGMYVTTIVVGIAVGVLYHQSKKLYEGWNQEDETVMSAIETKLSYALWFTSLMLISSYLLFTIGAYTTVLSKKVGSENIDLVEFIILMVGFILAIAFNSIAQQRIVNFDKIINPEKKGSVFDTKFHDKWMKGCDEAERFIIYKSAYKAYRVMNIAFSVAWTISIIGIVALEIGISSTVMITILWAIMTSVYSLQTIYYAKHPSEVMK